MFDHLSNYRPANPQLWQGKKNTLLPERFSEKIIFPTQETDLISKEKKIIFLGFADSGTPHHQGSSPAQSGPDHIKNQLAKLPCTRDKHYMDLGSIMCDPDELELAQNQFAELINFCHQQGHQTIALGGSREIALAHFQGLVPHYHRLGIINFSAHFDLLSHPAEEPALSGTAFSQIAVWCEENQRKFACCCLGTQPMSNTPSLFQKASQLNVRYLTAEDLYTQSLAWNLAFLDEFLLHQDSIYLTIGLDVLAECYAPGVNAPQPLGLTPWQILPLLKYIMQSGKVISLDIAKLSLPLDKDQKTARLAALIIAELLHTI